MPENNIVLLEAAQASRGGVLLAQAFHRDPLYTLILPDEDRRRHALGWMFDRVVRYALWYGVVYTTPSVEGVACWLPPGQTTLTLPRVVRSGLVASPLKLGLAAYRQFGMYMHYTDRWHEQYAPPSHWYLWAIGVDPACQGQGIGSQLLQPILTQADAEGTACYLETETEANVRFYTKHGFKVVDRGQVPGLGLSTFAMRREG